MDLKLALGAIFVSLIYGILRFAYFTAGDLMSFGTMFTILFTWYFQSLGINLGFLPTASRITFWNSYYNTICSCER